MVSTLLRELRHDAGMQLIALVLNEGTLSRTLRTFDIETVVIQETTISFMSLAWKARRHFVGRSVDIIHSHGYKENILSRFLAMALGVPRLFSTIHGLPESARMQSGLQRQRQNLMTKLNHATLKHSFTGVVAVSVDIRDTLVHREGFYEDRVKVIHNGIDISQWIYCPSSPARDSRVHIGTVGRMVPVKRFDRLLEVAAEVKKHNANVRFSILGDGPLKAELCRNIRRLGLEDSIDLKPPTEDPIEYYHSLDVYLNTSDHEGIPLSILEAMACKKPIIAPKVGGIPEIISHGVEGYLVQGAQSVDFARYCLDLIQDKKLRLTLGENAFKTVKSRFSSTKMSIGYRKLYQAGVTLNRMSTANNSQHIARSMP